MLYDHQEVIVYMLFIPVVLNICLPLVMLVGWLLKQFVWGLLRQSKKDEVVDQGQLSVTT
jgi:hypothetical protein